MTTSKPETVRKVAMAVALLLLLALLVFAALVRSNAPQAATPPTYWPTDGWQTTTPEGQGIDSARLAEALQTIRDRDIPVHSLMIIRNGSVVADASFYPYDGSTIHDLASETKSVVTILIGIAADQGKLNVDQPVLSFFPERTIANRDARKERMTVRHLASMTSGLDCTRAVNEPLTLEMRATPDPVQFALDRPMVAEPGARFAYCNLGSHLLSAILQQATGMTTLDFARQHLFEPLGIHDVWWPTDVKGVHHGWGDLHLFPQDMARIGYLWLNKGRWEDRQIVSRDWVEASVRPQIKSDSDDNYGLGWWLPSDASPGEFRADGRGGQYTVVYPSMNMIIQTTGGGFEGGQVGPLLYAALGDMTKPHPANADSVARLNATLTALVQPPAPRPVAPLSDMARSVSGKTIVLEPNPMGLATMRLDFDDSAEALWQITLADRDAPLAGPLGLDGVYRLSPGDTHDLPRGARGNWVDAQTFVFEYDEIASIDGYTFRMRFQPERVVIDVTARDGGGAFSMTGQAQGS